MKKLTLMLVTTCNGIFIYCLLKWEAVPIILFDLLFGWLFFVNRVFPQVTIRWDGIAFFAFFLGLAILVAHSFLGWIFRNTQTGHDVHPWKLRWTVSLLAIVLLIFGVGLSFVGVVHQVGWIVTSPGPFAVSKVQTKEDHWLSGYNPETIEEGSYHPSWIATIGPFLPIMVEVNDQSKSWNHPINAEEFCKVGPPLSNPCLAGPLKSPDGFGLAHFAANSKLIETTQPHRLGDIAAGTSNTYLIGECNAGFIPWGRLVNTRNLDLGFRHDWGGSKPGQVGYGPVAGYQSTMLYMADGSVRNVNVDVDPTVLAAMNSDPMSKEPEPPR